LEDRLDGWLDATRPGGLTGAEFQKEVAAGRRLLIFDGRTKSPNRYPAAICRGAISSPGWPTRCRPGRNRATVSYFTSRPYGLCAEDRRRLALAEAELADLPDALQELFVRRWYDAVDRPRAVPKAEGLLRHLGEREAELGAMRQNPVLLTALCVLWDQGQKLPEDFYLLYEALVGQVLYKGCPRVQ
jgi:hypothetical protein